jgi:hypothetical protein
MDSMPMMRSSRLVPEIKPGCAVNATCFSALSEKNKENIKEA